MWLNMRLVGNASSSIIYLFLLLAATSLAIQDPQLHENDRRESHTSTANPIKRDPTWTFIGYRKTSPQQALDYYNAGHQLVHHDEDVTHQIGPGVYLCPTKYDWPTVTGQVTCLVWAAAEDLTELDTCKIPEDNDEGVTLWWGHVNPIHRFIYDEGFTKWSETIRLSWIDLTRVKNARQMCIPAETLAKLRTYVRCYQHDDDAPDQTADYKDLPGEVGGTYGDAPAVLPSHRGTNKAETGQ